MKIPKQIVEELAKRGWTLCEKERWRKINSKDWACAYFNYKKRICLITVAYSIDKYYIQILYQHPVCSEYILNGRNFNVKMRD